MRATIFPLLGQMLLACCGGDARHRCGCRGLDLGGKLHIALRRSLSIAPTALSPSKHHQLQVHPESAADKPVTRSAAQKRGSRMLEIVQRINAIHYPAYTALYSADITDLSEEQVERRKMAFGTSRGYVLDQVQRSTSAS